MSCLCEMCGSSDIFAFDRNVRGIKEGVSKSSAGNFFWEIPFEREHGENPFEIRNILSSDKGSYFDTNGVPLLPFLSGRVGRITNLASIAHSISFPGTELICQLPSASFIKVGNCCGWIASVRVTIKAIPVLLSNMLCVLCLTTSGSTTWRGSDFSLWQGTPSKLAAHLISNFKNSRPILRLLNFSNFRITGA